MRFLVLFLCTIFGFPSVSSYAQTFTKHTTTAVPGRVEMIRADFNNDSIPDIALANSASNTVSIFLMNADGTFRGRQDFTTGQHPTGIIAADFNHDRKIDLATSNADPNDAHSVALLVGNGDGTFQAPKFFYGGTKPLGIGVGDFNGDGNVDVVTGWLLVPNPNDPLAKQPNEILITYGDGRSGFTSQLSIDDVGEVEPAGERDHRMRGLAVGDFNGDRRPDIAFVEGNDVFESPTPTGAVYVLTNNGKQNFTIKRVSDEFEPNAVAVADLNQDGLDDILVASYGCRGDGGACPDGLPAVKYRQNKGDGSFNDQFVFGRTGDELQGFFEGPTAADLNGDGLKDVAIFGSIGGRSPVGQQDETEVRFALQNTDGTFSEQQVYLTNMIGTEVAGLTADLNRDGRVDIVAASGGGQLASLVNSTPIRGCQAPGSFRKLNVCLPFFSPISSPVQVSANTRDGLPIEAMKIYVDGVSKFFATDDLLNTRLNLPAGDHSVQVKAWDRLGSFAQTVNFTVASGCVLSGIDRTVKICAPANGAAVTSPVHIQASITNSSRQINAVQIYVDGVLSFDDGFTQFEDAHLDMSKGKHRITVKAWDSAGPFSQSVMITVP